MKRAVITVGLGFGDEGKGAAVDDLCRRLAADLVVRYSGGSQAGHNVQLADGRRHTFSQFGAGTLAGARTFLAAPMIVHPTALILEADHLSELGVTDPFRTLSVHRDCLISTWFHQSLNQLRELSRGDQRHGSCGHGIGETRHYWLRHGDNAIFARDLRDGVVLRAKLELLRQRFLLDVQEFADRVPGAALKEYDLLGVTAGAVAEELLEIGDRLDVRETMPDYTTAIFEGAQGVLLDEWYGFHPHTTWSTVTPHHAVELAGASGVEELCVLGLLRGYTTRHGAGPLPSHDEQLTERTRDVGNPWNRWQGHLRAGWLDLVLLRYAARACGRLDNLGVSCLDQLSGEVRLCVGYDNARELPLPAGPDLRQQEELNRLLSAARPECVPATKEGILAAVEEIAPVAVVAHGPAHGDREFKGLQFRQRVRTSTHCRP